MPESTISARVNVWSDHTASYLLTKQKVFQCNCSQQCNFCIIIILSNEWPTSFYVICLRLNAIRLSSSHRYDLFLHLSPFANASRRALRRSKDLKVERNGCRRRSVFPSNRHWSVLPSNRHWSVLPSNRHWSVLPSNRHWSVLPNNRHWSVLPSNRHSSILPSNRWVERAIIHTFGFRVGFGEYHNATSRGSSKIQSTVNAQLRADCHLTACCGYAWDRLLEVFDISNDVIFKM